MDTWSLYYALEPTFTDDEPTDLGGYTEVAQFDRAHYPNPDDVFRAAQNLDEPWCIPPQRSMSVGDVLRCNTSGHYYLCVSDGWRLISPRD